MRRNDMKRCTRWRACQKQGLVMKMYASALVAGLLMMSPAAHAQSAFGGGSSGGGSSGRMWGAANGGGSAADSSLMHTQDGNAAGQVNAAKAGFLYGANITITSIGSQNIVTTTVYGNNNTTNVGTTQSSSNTGNVSNNGQIAPQ